MRLYGHPLHPAIAHFPVVCWTVPVLSDTAFLLTRDLFWARASIALLVAGLSFGLLAAFAGMIDLGQLKQKQEAERTAITHAMLMGSAFIAAGTSLLLREVENGDNMFLWQLATSALAAAFTLAGAFFGGELVYKFGFGAHPNSDRNDKRQLDGRPEK